MRRNPKISAPQVESKTKPKAPTPDNVPDEEIDHAGNNPAAEPIKADPPPAVVAESPKDEPEVVAAGAFDPATEDPEAAGKAAPDQTQKPEEGDPGKVKRHVHKRGPSPGDRITY